MTLMMDIGQLQSRANLKWTTYHDRARLPEAQRRKCSHDTGLCRSDIEYGYTQYALLYVS